MYHIRLVLADFDNKYVEKVTDFINSSFSPRIKISSYTRLDSLEEYLTSSTEKVDVLLAHHQFLAFPPERYKNVEIVLALADGSLINQPEQYRFVNKYQPGDKLVNQILSLYSETNAKVSRVVKGFNKTKLVSVYSPAGGAGKTSVVLGLASKLGELGQTVFCLSLESINSISAALSCSGNDALSHILLSLSENAETLPIKLETYKTRDSGRNIDFFEPTEHFLELSELRKENLELLLERLRQTGAYDIILVDLDAAANDKVVSVFNYSDIVVFVQIPDSIGRFKTEAFLSQINRIGEAEKTSIFKKLIPVMNKCNGNSMDEIGQYGLITDFSIPVLQNLWKYLDGRWVFDEDQIFCSSMTGLAKRILVTG